MEKEKIDKILELASKRYEAVRKQGYFDEVLKNLEGHNYSNKGLVHGLLENIERMGREREEIDDFYGKVFEVIKKEWTDICEKHRAIISDIDKELAEL